MPEYDAFGREVGENTLEGLGGSNARRATPSEWSAEDLAKAQAAARAEAQAAPAPPALPGDPLRAPEAPRVKAPVADPEPAAPQRPVFVPQGSGQRVVRRRVGFGCLGLFVGGPILLTILGLGAALLIGLSSVDTKTGLINIPRPSESPEIAPGKAAKPAKPPVGLQGKSLVRRANFARALRKLRAAGLGSPSSLRVAPERINAQLITKGGRLLNVQVGFDGKLDRQGGATPGFKFVRTMPFAQVNTAGPERLTRTAARRLGHKTSRLDYLVLSPGSGWNAYFKGGRIALGDARGGFVRRIS